MLGLLGLAPHLTRERQTRKGPSLRQSPPARVLALCYHQPRVPVCWRKEALVAQLLIRDLAPETVDRLKERARRNRRSLQGEIRLILEKEAAAGADDAWELADRIRASFGGRRFTESAALIREDRDR